MKKHIQSIVAVAGVLASSAVVAQADTFKLDPVHSTVIWRVSHLGASEQYGRFNEIAGTFNHDADPTKDSFDVTIKVDSEDSNSAARDKHLKSPDFFNAKQFPEITFKSTAVAKTEAGEDVTGDLTMKGVTKSVVIPLKFIGTGKGMQGETRAGYEGELTIKRSNYGVSGLIGPVGDDVKLIISVEGVQQ